MPADPVALKEEGNAFFRDQKFEDAIVKYTEAIEATTEPVAKAVIFSNRAQCWLSLKRWDDSRLDAAEALIIDHNNHKAWTRLGRAYAGSNLFNHARLVFEYGASIAQDRSVASLLQSAARDAEKQAVLAGWDQAHPAAGSQDHIVRASKLKEEGNALVNSQHPDFSAAYAKFTLALVFDPLSAILHCNRAYCANNLKRWDAAELDARLSIKFEPDYAKAWARLGAAKIGQREISKGEDAFKHGLQLLKDKVDRSSADTRLMESIERSLRDARDETRVVKGTTYDNDILPWALAAQVIKRDFNPLDCSTWYSSAWVILSAYEEFMNGCNRLYAIQGYNNMTVGNTGVLTLITNSIVSDPRSFFINRPDFHDKYKHQVMHEVRACNGFTDEGAQSLLQSVKVRLRAEGGWGPYNIMTSVRKAVSVTIRAWFLQAFLREKLTKDMDEALVVYKHVIDFIELGRIEWALTPKEERGVIFELTFLLGVRKIYAECLLAKYFSNQTMRIPDTSGLLELVKENANRMLEQVATFTDADRVPTIDRSKPPSFVLAFIFYTEAVAHAKLGYYWYNHARQSTNNETLMERLKNSVREFALAANIYPDDEEMRPEVLWQQLVSMFRSGRPLHETLPVCDELEKAMKDKQKIWRGSPNADGGKTDARYQAFVYFAEDARKAIEKGELTPESTVMPDAMNSTID